MPVVIPQPALSAGFTLKLGSLDLSSYLRVNPDDPSRMDPYSLHFVEPAFAETPYADGQALTSVTVLNREQAWPLFLSDPSHLKDQLHALIQQVVNAGAQRPLLLEWRDAGASASTFYDVQFVRFEPDFNFRRSVHGYGAGVLHVWTTGYGHTGTTRVCATAAGTGIFLSVPVASVGGDAPGLLSVTVRAGAALPSQGRIVALAPISQPSYAPRIPAASLTDLQPGAAVVGASGWDGSQYLALPVSPTGGASGVACKVPLPNPTIAGGDNRILAVVQAGIDAGVGIYALDPYGNAMGPTAVASMSQAPGLVDLGVCRLPTLGYPTLPKISICAGALWASGAAGPAILASPAGLALGEVLCLPEKDLALLFESAGGSVVSWSAFGFTGQALTTVSDSYGNPWAPARNHAHGGASGLLATGANLTEVDHYLKPYIAVHPRPSALDAAMLPGILSDSMAISAKPWLGFPAQGAEEVRLFKDMAVSQFVQARLAASGFLALESATAGASGNRLASVAIPTLFAGLKYRLSLRVQGPQAFVNLSRDDGGPVFAPGSMAQASIGVASDAGVAGPGAPALALSMASWAGIGTVGLILDPNSPRLYSWEVDTIPSSNLLPYDSYTIDGVNTDAYRTSSAGVFAGQKLTAVQRGAFPRLSPSTVSLAVVCAPFDQGPANDLLSAVVSVRERFSYGR